MKLSKLQKEKLFSLLSNVKEGDFDKIMTDMEIKVIGSGNSFTMKVNYDLPLQQMIALGKYNWGIGDITVKRFPVKDTGKKEIETKLFHFNRKISSDDIITEMENAGFRPAKPAELLKFGELYPDLQKEFPIIELGQWADFNGNHGVLYLDDYGDERWLSLGWYGTDWLGSCRSLGVRKVVPLDTLSLCHFAL